MIIITTETKKAIEESTTLNFMENIEVQVAIKFKLEQYKQYRDTAKDVHEFEYWNSSYNTLKSAYEKLDLLSEVMNE